MKIRRHKAKWIIGIFIGLVMMAGPAVAGTASPRLYRMEGKIVAIDSQAKTVVVNVPITRSTIFTVAGPLAKGATLLQGQKKWP